MDHNRVSGCWVIGHRGDSNRVILVSYSSNHCRLSRVTARAQVPPVRVVLLILLDVDRGMVIPLHQGQLGYLSLVVRFLGLLD